MPTNTTSGAFAEFKALQVSGDWLAFGERLAAEGFTAMRRFLDDFRIYLQTYSEAEADETDTLIRSVQMAIPKPGSISPSWALIWEEFEGIARYKRYVFEHIPAGCREGEWQVLLDNPHSTGNIAVYPALSFLEAAYMYAYFRTGLERTEIIRMQKIETVIFNTGADHV